MSILKMGKTFFAGINLTALFYKLVIGLGLVVLIATVSFREGVSHCQVEAKAEQVKQLETQIITERTEVREELNRRHLELVKRIETIGIGSKEAAKLKEELIGIKGDLNEAIRVRAGNSSCSPTDDELRLYEELAKRTARAAG